MEYRKSTEIAQRGVGVYKKFSQFVQKNLRADIKSSKALIIILILGLIFSLLPLATTPHVANADLISMLKAKFNGYSSSQNPINNGSQGGSGSSPSAAGATSCPDGQILIQAGNPPKGVCIADPAKHAWACPAGQVESGIKYNRDGPSTINCVSCPAGTIRMAVAGGEACHPPGWTPNYSNILPGYEVGANGQICRSDGQSYAGSPNPRIKVTYANYGECCNGGVRGPTVAGSVALFVCGAPGSPTGPPTIIGYTPPSGSGSGTQGAATPAPDGGQANGSGQGAPAPVTSCPDGKILIQAGTPPRGVCIPDPAKHAWSCPAGQVESGIIYNRDGPSPIRCVPCPAGTVRMFVGGGEACHPPDFKVDYSKLLPGYEVGANGQICLADGQSYAGSYNPRIKVTYANLGACCNGGRRDSQTVVAGSSVALFICGPGGSGGSGSSGANTGPTFRVSGVFEAASCTTLSGWVLDSVNTSRVVTVQFYADGYVGVGKKIGSVTPTVQRDDINATFKITGTHGFSWTVPSGTFAAGSTHKIYAYVLENTDQLLTGSPLAVTCASGSTSTGASTTFQGGPVDADPTFIISSPANGATIIGRNVSVSYYSTEQILDTDYVVLQLDSQAPVRIDTSTGGSYQFGNVLPGAHTIRGYLAHANGAKIPGTSTATTFTVQ